MNRAACRPARLPRWRATATSPSWRASSSKHRSEMRSETRSETKKPPAGAGGFQIRAWTARFRASMRVRIWLQLNTSATDQAHQDENDGDNQQDMDEAADGVGRDQAKHPQDQQNDCDCI